MIKHKVILGDDITNTAKHMVALANNHNDKVKTDFNGIILTANPGDSPQSIVKFYSDEMDRKRERYIKSPEYKQRQQEAKDAKLRKEFMLKGALVASPKKITLRNQKEWEKCLQSNKDGYGGGILNFAELWARLMEGRIANGGTLEECAEEASHLADINGITGFMYGAAVSILSQVWIHGEELRRWHNLSTQIGDEGEKANEDGGVLNPALLSIKV